MTPVRTRDEQRFLVSGVCCATEEVVLSKRLDAGLGRGRYSFNLITSELVVPAGVEARTVLAQVRAAGFDAKPKAEVRPPQTFLERHGEGVRTAAAALLALAGVAAEEAGAGLPFPQALYLGAILVSGGRVMVRALNSVRTLTADMNLLMTLAVVGAAAIGEWREAAAVMVLFGVSLMLESYSTLRTRRAVEVLMAEAPETASVVRDGVERTVPAREVLPGEAIVVRPGEKIPLDGVVTGGSSAVDEAVITGEPIPAAKAEGARVYAGSINGRGALQVRVTAEFEESALAHILHGIEDAQRSKAPVQSFVDRFAAVYTPAVLLLAVGVAAVPPLLLGQPFTEWLYRALVLLVIACPCALVISTPVTIVSALAAAARRGILVKAGKHLETLAKVKALAFDKTGTLTRGIPSVTDVVPLDGVGEHELLAAAAALEHRSEHPLASAVVAGAEQRGVAWDPAAVQDFESIPGLGVRGRIGGTEYHAGNRRLLADRAFASDGAAGVADALERAGKTVIVVARGGRAIGVIGVRDAARRRAAEAVRELRAIGIPHLVMLSGDNDGAARKAAEETGFERYEGGLLPEAKVARVRALMAEHGTVAMVGDGVNDAPALAASSVGIAMGVGGTDAALATADVVLMTDDLERLPPLFRLSRKALRVIRQNIAFALAVKAVFMVLSLAGVAGLWMAVLADDGAALLVILNGLRLLRPGAAEE
jgi:Cd2+/Zn2+-exporting ATPase